MPAGTDNQLAGYRPGGKAVEHDPPESAFPATRRKGGSTGRTIPHGATGPSGGKPQSATDITGRARPGFAGSIGNE